MEFEIKTMEYINLYFIYLSNNKYIHLTKKSKIDLKDGKINNYHLYRVLIKYHKLNNKSYRIYNSFLFHFDSSFESSIDLSQKAYNDTSQQSLIQKYNFINDENNMILKGPEIFEDLNGLYFLMIPYNKTYKTRKNKIINTTPNNTTPNNIKQVYINKKRKTRKNIKINHTLL